MKSSSSRGVGAGDGVSSSSCSHDYAGIPVAAKKVVQNLREIVKKHSDDEIYAALKDCDMDPNRAVHVLMNQDTFHEVKRRRVKKRENDCNYNIDDGKSGASISASRFDHGGRKINFVPRRLIDDGSGGADPRTKIAQKDGLPSHGGVRSQLQSQTRNAGMSRGSFHVDSTIRTSGDSWTRVSGSNASESVSTSVSTTPRLQSSIHTNASSGHWAPKRQEKLAMGLDKADEKRDGELCNIGVNDTSLVKSTKRDNLSMHPQKVLPIVRNSAGSSYESARSQDGRYHQAFTGKEKRTFSGSFVSRPSFQYYQNYKVSYKVHQRAPNFQKALEWKPKPPTTATVVIADKSSEALGMEKTGKSPPSTASPVSIEVPTELVSELEGINLLDEPPVIIPEHLKVPESECTGLNFGSFGTDFELSFSTGPDDSKCSTVGDTCVNTEALPVEPLDSSMTERPPVETSTHNHPQSLSATSAESFTMSSDTVLGKLPVAGKRTEVSKPEMITQQERHFSFISSSPDDQELGLGEPQTQDPYDMSESQRQEISRPNFVPFAEPSSSYFSPVFRPGSDVEARYQFFSSHGASKFSGNISCMNAQTISSSQEQSQNVGIPHTTLAVGQPSIPIHAYAGAQPAGVTIPPYPTNIYGYQYVPPNYAYMHPPYQASYPGNSGFLQPPIGSSFAPGGRVYPSAGSATVKFPPPQYKLGTGSTPHTMVAAGYGSYQTAPSGFAGINSSVTTGSASSYDDMIGPQYKENAIYTPSQQVRVPNLSLRQVDASALWVQSRDVPGMQANSFYNVHGAGQHAGYLPSQQAHAHHHGAGFASFSQSASGPNNHQLLQQPQALGSVGAGSHAVMFSQPQRGPVNWGSNYSNLIRSQ